jgi:CheY-like chemotaxis protein
LTILLAEDNVVNQKLALKLLERMGYTADVAANGAEAVAAVERARYDLVLMDVQMPEMDGLEATKRIIDRHGSDRPRIVALTADAMQDDRERCLAAGMDDYLTKPIRPAELSDALQRVALPAGASLDSEALDRVMMTAGGDAEFAGELLDSFNDDAPAIIQELREGLSSGDSVRVRRAATRSNPTPRRSEQPAFARFARSSRRARAPANCRTAKRRSSGSRLPI